MDLNQVIYTVFHAEFESGSRIGPTPPQEPIFKDFFKIMIFTRGTRPWAHAQRNEMEESRTSV